jgi:hypothetical protein
MTAPAVAAFVDIVSYPHIYALAVRAGRAGTATRLLSVDLLIVAGSGILLADSPLPARVARCRSQHHALVGRGRYPLQPSGTSGPSNDKG